MNMDSPLYIIMQMISLLVENGLSTLVSLGNLFGRLLYVLGFITKVGGGIGLAVSVIVLAAVGIFFAKFVLSSGKQLIILGTVALLLMILLSLSMAG